MRRSDVGQVLDRLSEAGLRVDLVLMAPLALCNFMTYDDQVADYVAGRLKPAPMSEEKVVMERRETLVPDEDF